MHIQPLPSLKVWQLWWTCWTSLIIGPLSAQSVPYFFQCKEQHWSVCRLADIADTAALSARESELLLPRMQTILRQWYDEGASPTMEWHFSEEIEEWREPLQRLRWSPTGVSMMQRGTWVNLDESETPEALPFPESLSLPILPSILPDPEVRSALGAMMTGDNQWTWPIGEGWSVTAQADPPEWRWFHDNGRVERWELAPLGSAWYVHIEESTRPITLSTGICAQAWSWVERSALEGFEGQIPNIASLVISPNPHDLGEISLSLQDGSTLQPTRIEFRDVQGRVAWSSENSPPFPLFLHPPLSPGRYTVWAHFGPFSIQAPFLQL